MASRALCTWLGCHGCSWFPSWWEGLEFSQTAVGYLWDVSATIGNSFPCSSLLHCGHRGLGRTLGCFLPLAVWIAPSGTVRVVLREEASRSSPAILPTFQYADQIDLLFTFLKRKFHSLNHPSSTQSHLNSVLSTSPTPSHLNVPLHYVMLAWQASSKFGNIVPTSLFQLHGKCPTLHKDRHFPEFSIKSA